MKSLLILLSIFTLSACGGSSSSPENIPTIPAVSTVTNPQLENLSKLVVNYQGLPFTIQVGYGVLPNGIAGTFFGKTPSETSNIVISNDYKDKPLETAWVTAHEYCHLGQWLNGVKFDQLDIDHDSRDYEIQCNTAGTMFLNDYIKRSTQ